MPSSDKQILPVMLVFSYLRNDGTLQIYDNLVIVASSTKLTLR